VVRGLKVGEIIETQQPGIHKQLNKNRNIKQNKSRRGKKRTSTFVCH